jgi:hypothetical protein
VRLNRNRKQLRSNQQDQKAHIDLYVAISCCDTNKKLTGKENAHGATPWVGGNIGLAVIGGEESRRLVFDDPAARA